MSFEAKANYLQPRHCGAATKEARLLQPFLAQQLSPEPANIQVDRQRQCDCVSTAIRDGGGERGPVCSGDFLARPRSSAHAAFLMERTGLHTSPPSHGDRSRGVNVARTPPPHSLRSGSNGGTSSKQNPFASSSLEKSGYHGENLGVGNVEEGCVEDEG